MKKFIQTILVLTFLFLSSQKALAADHNADSVVSAKLADASLSATYPTKEDYRVAILKDYLTEKNSPLADYAKDFVENADKNGLDWKLVAAISGVESTFGQQIPSNSYNGWGWGVYGDHVIRFTSWDEAIAAISKGLKDNYVDKGAGNDVYAIGRSYAASPAWAGHVTYFLNNIQAFADAHPDKTLSLSL